MSTLDLFSLKPAQAMAGSVLLKHKRLALILPRQEGKTELGIRLIRDLIDCPQGARTALCLAKSKKAAQKAAREKFFRLFDKKDFQRNTEIVYYKSNPSAVCYIDSVDKDPDRIRGGSYDFVHWLEVAFSRFEHGVSCMDVWDKVISPAFRVTKGYALLESTCNGKNGWYDFWEICETLGFTRMRITLSQLVEMGLCARTEYDFLKSTTQPDVFRQEYECEWVTFSARMYVDMKAHHVQTVAPPEDWQTVLGSIDWGFVDATAIIFAYVRDGHMYVFDEIYVSEKTLDEIYLLLAAKLSEYKMKNFVCVADHDTKANAELSKRKIHVVNAQKSDVLGNRIEVKERFFKNEITIDPRCRMLLKDLEAATWHPKKNNEIDESQCTWGHFDMEAAFRYLVREAFPIEAKEVPRNPFPEKDVSNHAAWAEQNMMNEVMNAYR